MTELHYLKRELDELLSRRDARLVPLLQEGQPDDLYLWDVEQPDNLWTSPTFWRTLGYDPAHKPQTRAALRAVTDERDRASAQFDADQLVRGHAYDRALRFRDQAGRPLWFRSRAVLLRDAEGRPSRVLGIRTNLTDMVVGRDERFWHVLEAVPNAIVVVDRTGTIHLVNARACELLGYERQELLECSVSMLVPAELRELHAQHIRDFFHQGCARRLAAGRELVVRCKDGSVLPVEISLSPMQTAGASLIVATIEDLTERKRAQAAREHLAAIVDSSEDAILSATLDGVVTSWNPGAQRLFGFTAGEAIGRPLGATTVPASRAQEVRDVLRRIAAGESVPAWETLRTNKAGQSIDVSITLAPLRDMRGSVTAASAIIRDIRPQKARDRALERSNAELEQFAYIASHDLQEPLRSVANFSQLLLQRYQGKLDDKADRYLHHVFEGARRMQQLVSDLLAYSRVRSDTRAASMVALETVVARAIDALQTQVAETGASFEVDALPRVVGITPLLVQLFQNLIGNALKYRSEEPARVVIRAHAAADAHHISVTDNGIGFDMAHAEKVFQMFQRLHSRAQYPGSGIGLAIAQRIVERHGGRVWAESQPGVGSTFHFTLAVTPPGMPRPHDANIAAAPADADAKSAPC